MSNMYIIFPQYGQPSAQEVQLLNSHMAALGGFAAGNDVNTGDLALQFDHEAFQSHCRKDFTFQSLISEWRGRGCRIVSRLTFHENPGALQPAQPDENEIRIKESPREREARLRLEAAEAKGRSGLQVHRTVERIRGYGAPIVRYGAYVVTGALAGGVLLAGGMAARKLLNSGLEKRGENLRHMAEDSKNVERYLDKKKEAASEEKAQKPKINFTEKEENKKAATVPER
jgi:hypothetical protein